MDEQYALSHIHLLPPLRGYVFPNDPCRGGMRLLYYRHRRWEDSFSWVFAGDPWWRIRQPRPRSSAG